MTGAGAAAARGTAVKSAARTVEVLEALAAHGAPASLSELAARLEYPRSSMHVLLRTLTDLGWLETDPTGTRYRVGMRALAVGASYVEGDEVVRRARDVLDALAGTTTETVHLARLDGSDVVYLATRASQHYLRPFSRVGRRLPAHATALGKALLSCRGDDEVLGIVGPGPLAALTPRTLTDPADLLTELDLTRRRGHAIDSEENTLGLHCFAVPVQPPPRRGGRVVDAISCSVPLARLDRRRAEEIVEALHEARSRIERLLLVRG